MAVLTLRIYILFALIALLVCATLRKALVTCQTQTQSTEEQPTQTQTILPSSEKIVATILFFALVTGIAVYKYICTGQNTDEETTNNEHRHSTAINLTTQSEPEVPSNTETGSPSQTIDERRNVQTSEHEISTGSAVAETRSPSSLNEHRQKSNINLREPNLPALQKFPYKDGDIDIISETAGCYKRIGIFLLNDKTGGIVNVITMEHSKPEDKMTAIYERWLQKGASWEQLIQVLKDCNLHVLANNIEEGLKDFHMKTKVETHFVQSAAVSHFHKVPIGLPYGSHPNLSEAPSMPELLRLRLPQKIGANCFTFGMFLLNDKTGSRIESFEMASQRNPEYMVYLILREWLEGKGLPVTWRSLVQTLRDTGLPDLADQIHLHHI